ncbi:MAG: hypothetical protein RBR35_15575 [Salinivirgaceae bacterium]|nr:hypothetical protein [Salinivirgaceae bacterium]
MNTYATKGHKIMVTPETMKLGQPQDRENVLKSLKPGRIYTVDRTKIYPNYTAVFLVEFPYIEFNSIYFVDVKQKRGRPRRSEFENRVLFPQEFKNFLIENRNLKPAVAGSYISYINSFKEQFGDLLPHPAQFERMVDEKNIQQIEWEFDQCIAQTNRSLQGQKTVKTKKSLQNGKSALAQYRLFLLVLMDTFSTQQKPNYLPKQLTISNLSFDINYMQFGTKALWLNNLN